MGRFRKKAMSVRSSVEALKAMTASTPKISETQAAPKKTAPKASAIVQKELFETDAVAVPPSEQVALKSGKSVFISKQDDKPEPKNENIKKTPAAKTAQKIVVPEPVVSVSVVEPKPASATVPTTPRKSFFIRQDDDALPSPENENVEQEVTVVAEPKVAVAPEPQVELVAAVVVEVPEPVLEKLPEPVAVIAEEKVDVEPAKPLVAPKKVIEQKIDKPVSTPVAKKLANKEFVAGFELLPSAPKPSFFSRLFGLGTSVSDGEGDDFLAPELDVAEKKPAKKTAVEAEVVVPVPEKTKAIAENIEPKPVAVPLVKTVRKVNVENLITLEQITKNAEAKKQEIDRKVVSLEGAKEAKAKLPSSKTSSGPTLASTNDKLGLQIKNLGKSYGDKPAVRDISLTVQRGEAVGLLGPNGAGKTTSFYMTMGLIKPDYGTISLDGVDITHLPVYRRARMGLGYLPQEASIFRGMTVEENILSVLELSEPAVERRHAKLESLLGEFSVTHLRRSPAIALSGGERRRVEIARALASNPSFILLDEPLAGIDPVAVADIKQLISHLKNRGIGVLITDHNVRDALDLINRAYIIHDGKVLMEGTPQEIVGNKEVRRVYLGDKFSL